MIENRIAVSEEPNQSFDKMQLALAIRNGTFHDSLDCSLLMNGVLADCKSCTLKLLCDEIDKLSESYTNETTDVVNSFYFDK